MIVIGLDVHKQSVTAVAVDEAGRPLEEKAIRVGSDELLGWAGALDEPRAPSSRRNAGRSPGDRRRPCREYLGSNRFKHAEVRPMTLGRAEAPATVLGRR
jgi:hypothetical protein